MYTLQRSSSFHRVQCRGSSGETANCHPICGGCIRGSGLSNPERGRQNTFDAMTWRPLIEDGHSLMTYSTQFSSAAMGESTVRDRIMPILALLDDTIADLFEDSDRGTEASTGMKIIFVIRTAGK